MRWFPALPLAAVAALAACSVRDAGPKLSDLHGVLIEPKIGKPTFTLTATDGRPYAFRERTRGKLTLLFFGYTNCPDVCPVHTANIASVLHTMSWEDRQRITFVFVTTDPDRDSLPALRAWLWHFDSSFVGLRGPIDSVNAIQARLNLPGAVAVPTGDGNAYGVQHSAVVIAFQPDDTARVMYPFGVRQHDWAADLPKLLGHKQP